MSIVSPFLPTSSLLVCNGIITKSNLIVPISGTSFIIIALMLKLDTPKTPLLAGVKIID